MRNIQDTRTMTTYELLKYAKRGIFDISIGVEYKVDKLKKEGNEEYKKYESEIKKLDEQYNEIVEIMRKMEVE